MLGRANQAVADAEEAQRQRPSPGQERLLQRAFLAARRRKASSSTGQKTCVRSPWAGTV